MSGGSWEYVFGKVDYVGMRLQDNPLPALLELGGMICRVADALHDIEWVDSADKMPGDEISAIETALACPLSVLDEVRKQKAEAQRPWDWNDDDIRRLRTMEDVAEMLVADDILLERGALGERLKLYAQVLRDIGWFDPLED